MQHITVTELAHWLNDPARTAPLLLDVREPWEFETCKLAGAQLMPMRSIPSRLSELAEETPVICICHHGTRSMQVAHFLERNGFTEVTNLTGGMHAWAQQVDPSMPVY